MEEKQKNIYHVCDECLGVNVRTLIPKIQKLDPDAEIIIGCQSMCGPGRTRTFAMVNNRPVIAKDEIELLPKIKKRIEAKRDPEKDAKHAARMAKRLAMAEKLKKEREQRLNK